jgi:ubiquinone/menaquinone biosynthesis C-methylase UbiE
MKNQIQQSIEPEKIRNFYNKVYYKGASPNKKILLHFKRLVSKLPIGKGCRVLDVACGTGQWLLAVHDAGCHTAGIDISSKAIEICKINLPDGEFYTGQAETLPFEDKRFNLVSCLGALEHFLDPSHALKEMVRTATDDAYFLLLVPNAGFLTRRLGLFEGTAQFDIKEEWQTLDAWKQLFEESGLQIEKRWKDLHILSWSWIRSRNWYHVPLRALQAIALIFWPLSWQYQVYHLCRKKV